MPLADGARFAGFTIIRLLGQGGMGEVYLATHPRLPRQNALKILPASVSADADFRERFSREADLASTLFHPHIVGVHDRGDSDGQLWISMDYVDGADAARVLTDRYPGGMPHTEVAAIVNAVASALDYAHRVGLLHRDVKPANIMLSRSDADVEQRILLTDFGIARNLDDISGLTITNTTVGTLAYTAPEQLMGESLDGRADQYALAATAYHLLTGAQLFPHTNPAVVIGRHLNAAPPAVSELRPDLGPLDSIMTKALSKDPDNRFARCSHFAKSFSELADSGDAVTPSAVTAFAPVPRRHDVDSDSAPSRTVETSGPFRRRWLIPVAILATVGVIAAVFAAWRPWDQGASTSATIPSAAPQTSPPSVSTSPPPPPPPPVFPAAAINTLLLGAGEINDTVGASTLEVADDSFGTSDNTAEITPASCVGVIYGAQQRAYRETGFLQMRDQSLSPRPYTEAEAYEQGPWRVQQTVAVFPAAEQGQSFLTSSESLWRSCAGEQVMQKGYEFTTPWELSNIQVRDNVLTVSLADLSVTGPTGGACQHALGVRANVVAEAIACTAETTVAGNGAERVVFAILDRVRV